MRSRVDEQHHLLLNVVQPLLKTSGSIPGRHTRPFALRSFDPSIVPPVCASSEVATESATIASAGSDTSYYSSLPISIVVIPSTSSAVLFS